ASTAGSTKDVLPQIHVPVFDERLELHMQEVVFEARDAKGQKLDPSFVNVFWKDSTSGYFTKIADVKAVRPLGDFQMLHPAEYVPEESLIVWRGKNKLMPGKYELRMNLGYYGQISREIEVKAGEDIFEKIVLKSTRGVQKIRIVDKAGNPITYVSSLPSWRPKGGVEKDTVESVLPTPVLRSPIPRGGEMMQHGGGRGGLGGRRTRLYCRTSDGWMYAKCLFGVEGRLSWSFGSRLRGSDGSKYKRYEKTGMLEDGKDIELEIIAPKPLAKGFKIFSGGDAKSAAFTQPVGFNDPVPKNRARIYFKLKEEITGKFRAEYGDKYDYWPHWGKEPFLSVLFPDGIVWADVVPDKNLMWGWESETKSFCENIASFKAGTKTELKIDFSKHAKVNMDVEGSTLRSWANYSDIYFPVRGAGRVYLCNRKLAEKYSIAMLGSLQLGNLPEHAMSYLQNGYVWPLKKELWATYCRFDDKYYHIGARRYSFEYPAELTNNTEITVTGKGLWLKVVDNKGFGIPFVEGTIIPLAEDKLAVQLRDIETVMTKNSTRPELFTSSMDKGNKLTELNIESSIEEIDNLLGGNAASALDSKSKKLKYAQQGAWYDPLSRAYSDSCGYMHMDFRALSPKYIWSNGFVSEVETIEHPFEEDKLYVLYLWSLSRDDLKPDRRIVFKGADLIDLGVIEMPGYVASEKK
ncbi:MAG: hypothetical protein L3J82_01795, partial [Planctomycetes bacterium]|nr:hypothetical protein [Planctomycetota bacterium]